MSKLNYLLIFVLLIALFSCKDEKKEVGKYGSTLKINEPEYIRTLYPHNLKDIVSSHVITQVYEGLVKFDSRTLEILPAIAKKWEISDSDTIYTFHLRNDVYFHDNPCFSGGKGRKVTAQDFKYTFELLCTNNNNNKNYFGIFDKVVGTYKYYEESENGKPNFDIEGIKVINDSTLQLIIEKPVPFFLNLLANPVAVVIPKEGIIAYSTNNFVGSGPYMIKEMPKKNETLYLLKHQNYYGLNSLESKYPIIDTIKISFFGSTHKEIEMFENGELDVVLGLKSGYVNEFFENHKEDFMSKPPKYILEESDENANLYNLKKAHVYNLFGNTLNYLDYSKVYFDEPKIIESNKKDSIN